MVALIHTYTVVRDRKTSACKYVKRQGKTRNSQGLKLQKQMMHACSQYVHTHSQTAGVSRFTERKQDSDVIPDRWQTCTENFFMRLYFSPQEVCERGCAEEMTGEKSYCLETVKRSVSVTLNPTSPKLSPCLPKHALTHTQAHASTRLTTLRHCSVRHHSVTPPILSYFQNTKCSDPICGAKFKLHNLMRLLFLLCFIMSRSKLRWSLCICCKASHSNNKNIVYHVQLILKLIFHRENKRQEASSGVFCVCVSAVWFGEWDWL